jgi:lipoprotein-anchoring transpeptidase ErfK/SrfK
MTGDDDLRARVRQALAAGREEPPPGFQHRVLGAVATASERSAGRDGDHTPRLVPAVAAFLALAMIAAMLAAYSGLRATPGQNADVIGGAAAQARENRALREGADALESQTGGSVDAMRSAGQVALADGRNDASVAAYLNRPSPLAGWPRIRAAYDRLESYAPMLGSTDVNQVALASYASERYAGEIHADLLGGLPGKTIVVSLQAQQLWAYDGGRLATTTLVTTGSPAVPTDVGPMKVLRHAHPWTIKSPYPKGSVYWYPNTVVQWMLWFTTTGEGLHDAPWQACCYGPGSENDLSLRSHGAIHVPVQAEVFLYNWAPDGTPVIVYPGDGTPVGSQLSQMTTDDRGNPLGPPPDLTPLP